MYEEQDNEIQGENDIDGRLIDFKKGSVIEGDGNDGEVSYSNEENWIEEEDDIDGEISDGEEEYFLEKENDIDSEKSFDEEDIVMEDEGRYKRK